jgi:ABC-type glycerol-3-phosphate transport system permease component
VPALVTAIGLIFAVLTERVRWSVAFKIVVFMPMAISLFAAGVIWHLMDQRDPSQGTVNAAIQVVHFFAGIPKDVLESARIDGASELRIFVRLMLPLGLPAIASLAIFSQLRQFGSNIELIAPASFVSLAIPLVVFLAFQRSFVQGLLAGSVK